jgi:hypothetical protein
MKVIKAKKLEANRLGDFLSERGQAGIVVLLMTVVLVTIGLSVASRSVTDIRFSEQEEETTRAFDIAEAGVEEALRQDLSTFTPGTLYQNPINPSDSFEVSQGNIIIAEIEEGEAIEVDVSSFSGDVDINWGAVGEQCNVNPRFASLVVSVINNSGNLARTAYTRSGCNRADNFSQTAGASPLTGYELNIDHPVAGSDQRMRIRAVYAGTNLLVQTDSGDFPDPQYYIVHSEAQTAGGESRAVEVTKSLPIPPSIFDFAVFSGGTLTK